MFHRGIISPLRALKERVDSPISEFIFYSCQEPKYVGVGGELHWSWASNRPCSLSPGNSTCMAIKVPKILERQGFIFWGGWGKGCGIWKGEITLWFRQLGFACFHMFNFEIFKFQGMFVMRMPVPEAVQKLLMEELSFIWRKQCQTSHEDSCTARLCFPGKSFSGKGGCAGRPGWEGRLALGVQQRGRQHEGGGRSSLNHTMSWLRSWAAPGGSWLFSF